MRFILIDTGSIYKGIESSVFTAGWHHFAAVWDGIDEKIYVDDVDDSQTAIENGTVTIITTTANTKVDLDTNSVAHYFNNLIDEIRIRDKALKPKKTLNPDISVEKGDSKSAHVDDIITCTVAML